MKHSGRFAWLVLLILMTAMSSCRKDTADLGGVPVTPEMLESVSQSLADATRTSEASVTYEKFDGSEIGEIVYWTESGTVYHHSKDCSSLKHSDDIRQGSVREAQAANKERACKSCS